MPMTQKEHLAIAESQLDNARYIVRLLAEDVADIKRMYREANKPQAKKPASSEVRRNFRRGEGPLRAD